MNSGGYTTEEQNGQSIVSYGMSDERGGQSTSMIGNGTDFYATAPTSYAYMTSESTAALMPTTQFASSFFQPTAYIPTAGPPVDFNLLWPWHLDMIHGGELNSPLAEYSTNAFQATNQSGTLPNCLPPLQRNLTSDFPLSTFMTRSGATATSSGSYSGRSHTTGRKGGRLPRELEVRNQQDLTDDQKDKNAKRRERNKQAAARCRARRVEQMNSLQDQLDKAQEENRRLQVLIADYAESKRQLEDAFQQHRCCLPQSAMKNEPLGEGRWLNDYQMKNTDVEHSIDIFKSEQMGGGQMTADSNVYPSTTGPMIMSNDPIFAQAALQQSISNETKSSENLLNSENMNDSTALNRPTTLSLGSLNGNVDFSSFPSINTPSNIGLALFNQVTHLTPNIPNARMVTGGSSPPPSHSELRQL